MTEIEPKPVKRLGQNWLRDPFVLERMIAAAQLRPTDLVIEIGPGLGVITKALAKQAGQVIAYEVDPNLVRSLKEDLHWAQNVQIVEKNILAKDFQLPQQSYKVVASLPYYITSPILEILLKAHPIASLVVLMVQREVAEKIVSSSPDGSYLSNFVRLFGDPEIIQIVHPDSFYPKPQVDSAILLIKTFPEPLVSRSEVDQMIALLHAGFTEPRKQLHNSLTAGLKMDTPRVKMLLQLANIDSERRAETLALNEWLKLYEVIKKA